jgi:hypothetical protein
MQLKYSRRISTKNSETDTIDMRYWEAVQETIPSTIETEQELVDYCKKIGRKMKVAVAVLMDETVPKPRRDEDEQAREGRDRSRRD